MVKPRTDGAWFPRAAEPGEFYPGGAAVIPGGRLAAEIARPEGAGALVPCAGGEGFSAHHHRHAGRGGGAGQGGAKNFRMKRDAWCVKIPSLPLFITHHASRIRIISPFLK